MDEFYQYIVTQTYKLKLKIQNTFYIITNKMSHNGKYNKTCKFYIYNHKHYHATNTYTSLLLNSFQRSFTAIK